MRNPNRWASALGRLVCYDIVWSSGSDYVVSLIELFQLCEGVVGGSEVLKEQKRRRVVSVLQREKKFMSTSSTSSSSSSKKVDFCDSFF